MTHMGRPAAMPRHKRGKAGYQKEKARGRVTCRLRRMRLYGDLSLLLTLYSQVNARRYPSQFSLFLAIISRSGHQWLMTCEQTILFRFIFVINQRKVDIWTCS